MSKFSWLSAATAMSLIATTGVTASAQQRAVVQQRTAPEPPGPALGLAQPEIPQQDVAFCPGYRVHVTIRGVAFECSDFKTQEHFVMVVRDAQYSGAGEAVVALLNREASLSNEYISDPQKRGSRLKVRHRTAGQAARGVCAITRAVRDNVPCREVVDLWL